MSHGCVGQTCSVCKNEVTIGCHKFPKVSDTRKLCCNHPKTGKKRFYHRVMHPKDADIIANSKDPDQTAPQKASMPSKV